MNKCRSYCNQIRLLMKNPSIIHKTFFILIFSCFSLAKLFFSFFPFNQTASRNERLQTGWCALLCACVKLKEKTNFLWYRIPNRYFIRGSIKHPTDRKFLSFIDEKWMKFFCVLADMIFFLIIT